MSDLKLGVLIDDHQQRDAIHIAVAPVIAAETLYPGQHIGFWRDGDTETVGPIADGPRGFQNRPAIGIVDPFLTQRVLKGDRCWMFLYPQTITSLRHDWTHPAFAAMAAPTVIPDKAVSEKFLRDYAEKYPGWSLEKLLESAENKLRGDDGYNSHTDIQNGASDDLEEFWRHFEVFTGKKVDGDARQELPYYCAC